MIVGVKSFDWPLLVSVFSLVWGLGELFGARADVHLLRTVELTVDEGEALVEAVHNSPPTGMSLSLFGDGLHLAWSCDDLHLTWCGDELHLTWCGDDLHLAFCRDDLHLTWMW